MNVKMKRRWLGFAMLPALLTLAACATPFNANVSRFQRELPAPAGQTFAVVAENANNAGGLEFGQYATLVAAQLQRIGYVAGDPKTADLIVEFDYGVDNGRQMVRNVGPDPYWGPYYGRRGFYRGWGYGWNDPWLWGPADVVTVYTSGIDVRIDRRADGKRLFEGKAQAVSSSNRLPYVVPKLVEAFFTGFPGKNGETVRISVAPEKK